MPAIRETPRFNAPHIGLIPRSWFNDHHCKHPRKLKGGNTSILLAQPGDEWQKPSPTFNLREDCYNYYQYPCRSQPKILNQPYHQTDKRLQSGCATSIKKLNLRHRATRHAAHRLNTLQGKMSPLFPYFQPIVAVANGKIVGYEALARQHDAKGKVISAGALFSSPDLDAKQRTELDRQVRWLALQKFSQLHDNESYLVINISAAWIDNLRQLNALPTLRMLDEFNIDRSRIIVAISDAQVDIQKLKQIVLRYRKHGLKVAIDDFGAGSSQLERVIAIQPDIIKIDMRLFKQAAKGGIASDIVHLMSRLGKRTGSRIICEGVETDEEFLFGLNCGAQYMQGFLFAKAEAEFKPAGIYEQHIKSLRNKFLKNTLNRVQKKIEAINTTKALISKLAVALQDDFNLNELVSWNFSQSGIIRFYLCNNQGDQISPDFNFSENRWFTDPRKIGFNWSWRPYFFQLLALENCGDLGRIVASERYLDFETSLLCKTLSLRLDSDRILLVDTVATDT